MKIDRSTLTTLALTTLFNFLHPPTGVGASAIAQFPSDDDSNNNNSNNNNNAGTALININNKLYQIPLAGRIIHTDITPPSTVTRASVIDGPTGFGCIISERGNRPLGTFTTDKPLPRTSPLPPKIPGEPERNWPPIETADTLTCYISPSEANTYFVWLLHDDIIIFDDPPDGSNFAIDPTRGIRQTDDIPRPRRSGSDPNANPNANPNENPDVNPDPNLNPNFVPSSYVPTLTPSNSPREELIFIQAGSIMGAEDFAAPGRPVVRALLVDAPYPQAVCLLHLDGGDAEQFDLIEAAEAPEGRLSTGLRCFRGW